MTKRLLLPLLTGLSLAALCACKRERDPCLQPRVVSLRAGAYHHADTGTAVSDTLLGKPYLVALDATAASNTFIYTGKTSKLTFNLSESADSTRWIVRPDSANAALQDTLTFRYGRQLNFLSNSCGYAYFYFLNEVAATHHALDSVIISTASVTSTANVEHIKIYY